MRQLTWPDSPDGDLACATSWRCLTKSLKISEPQTSSTKEAPASFTPTDGIGRYHRRRQNQPLLVNRRSLQERIEFLRFARKGCFWVSAASVAVSANYEKWVFARFLQCLAVPADYEKGVFPWFLQKFPRITRKRYLSNRTTILIYTSFTPDSVASP